MSASTVKSAVKGLLDAKSDWTLTPGLIVSHWPYVGANTPRPLLIVHVLNRNEGRTTNGLTEASYQVQVHVNHEMHNPADDQDLFDTLLDEIETVIRAAGPVNPLSAAAVSNTSRVLRLVGVQRITPPPVDITDRLMRFEAALLLTYDEVVYTAA